MQQDDLEGQVKERLVLTYLQQAIGEKEDIPWRIATRLFDTGLISNIEVTDTTFDQIINVLKKDDNFILDHSSPVYFFSDKQREDIPYKYIELTDLLGWRNIEIAKLIAPCIERAINHNISSDNIKQLTRDYVEFVIANDLKNALSAAARLDEALMDDWEWNILLLKKASSEKINLIFKRQIPRLLNIDPIEIGLFTHLQKQYNNVISILSSTDQKHKSKEVPLDINQVDKLGSVVAHLPWSSNVGFGSVLEYKNDYSDKELAIWPVMEQWLDYDKPAWWFHVWHIAVTHPENVPDTAWKNIWNKIEILLGSEVEGNENEVTIARRYSMLLQLYIYRLEASLSGEHTNFIFWSASKLASDIISSCEIDNSELDEFIGHAVEDAKLVWQVATPIFPNTSIRSTFIELQTYWKSAVQSSIISWDISKIKENIPETTLIALKDLVYELSLKLNIPDNPDSLDLDSTNSLVITNLSSLRSEWKLIFSDEETQQYISSHLELINKFSNPENILEKASTPLVDKDIDGVVAQSRLNGFVRDGRITTAQLFDLISSENWRGAAEPSMPVVFIYHIIESLLGSQWIGRENLHIELPHWAANQCLDNLDDEERCEAYFMATVLFSIKGNTSSAVSRVLVSDKENVLSDNNTALQNTLKRALYISPAWLSGRLRAILAVLSL